MPRREVVSPFLAQRMLHLRRFFFNEASFYPTKMLRIPMRLWVCRPKSWLVLQ